MRYKTKQINIGDNLSNLTMVFSNLPSKDDEVSKYLDSSVDTARVLESSGGYYIEYGRTMGSKVSDYLNLYKTGSSLVVEFIYYMDSWIVLTSADKYILPEDFGIITSLNSNFSKYFKAEFPISNIIVDEGYDYTDVFDEKYQEVAKKDIILPKFKIQLLDVYENIVDEITGDISTDNQGTISINYQQGVRRSITLTFIDTTGKFLPDANGNIIWLNKKFKVFTGLKDSETKKTYWFSQGVYYFTNSNSSRVGGDKITTITGVDKFGIFGSELGYNQLESTYLIPAGTNIYEAIKGILNLDLGNGYPIDSIEPILDPVFKDEVCPYDISKAPSSYLSEILIELADILGSDIYYDGTGRLRVENGTIDASYSNKSAIWDFSDILPEYIDPSVSTNFVDFINAVKVVGNNINDTIYEYTAYNNNPNSPTRIDLIGQKLMYIESAAVYNKDRAKDYAEYKLNTLSIAQLAISFSCTFLPHLDVNKVISITDKYFNYNRQRFIIQSLTLPLSFDGIMSVSACSLSSLPYYEGSAG